MTTFAQLKLSSAARPLVDRLLARASNESDRAQVVDLLVKAAGADGNKVLSASEVQHIADAFQAAQMGEGQLTPQALGIGLEKGAGAVKSMSSLSNLDGITTDFTLTGSSVEAKLIASLNASVARANGRPMDVNMTIFEFQSDAIEKAITDLARQFPNVTFRIIADSTQASNTNGNALPSLLGAQLPNVQVKFKKDFPYTWNQQLQRPAYNHGATSGLNHHKGFTTFIDGRPDMLVTGSFNWSSTADTKNYEDLTTFLNTDASSRHAITQFGEEFAGFWNNREAALSPNDFANFKGTKWNELMAAHGQPPSAKTDRPSDAYADYALTPDRRSADLNSFDRTDATRLSKLLGSTLARAILADRKQFGRFASLAELQERVPQTTSLSAETLAALHFGSGLVSINAASLEELDKVGFTKKQAQAIVAAREKSGAFERIDDLVGVGGLTQRAVNKLRDSLTAVDVQAYFNSRPWGAAAGGTGYGPAGARQVPVMGTDGTVRTGKASVVVGAVDLFNRAAPPTQISVAMYGMSAGSQEYRALVEAARRGVPVRVVLNDDFNDGTVAGLTALRAQGLPVDVRVQKAKTMHEKFGVVGDDVFQGSANFSESSSTKHSENRISIKNHEETAESFQARFELLWEKSKPT